MRLADVQFVLLYLVLPQQFFAGPIQKGKAMNWEQVTPARDTLGECPVWSAAEQALWWVDIYAPALQRLDPYTGEVRRWDLPEHVGSFAFCGDGGLLLALRSGLARFDPADGTLTRCAPAPYDIARLRFNDGRCDRTGRFWVGSMAEDGAPDAALYSHARGGGLIEQVAGVRISNGLGFSPDGRTLYHADTPTRRIEAHTLDSDGTLHGRRTFIELPPGLGLPDGAAVDADGCYWIALLHPGAVARFTPAGVLDRLLPIPVNMPTMPAFGGRDLDTLFVTSATIHLDEAGRAAEPLAGSVFALRPGVQGLPETLHG